ncbi:MAG: alpha/beta fold hydrolase [Herpetosiphonaceae bacterium]|nr:alpha/beta fold hydrolase [Herpetosiphonaceae bacterium]
MATVAPWRWVRCLIVTVGGGLATIAIFNLYAQRRQAPLPSRLEGEVHSYRWRGHTIAYTIRGEGVPLLLVHSVNGTASSFELRKQWSGLVEGRRLYALDLLGFGGSDRPDVAYSAQLFTDLITDFVHDVVGQPTAVLASSLSSSFVVAAAAREPHLFTQLLLIEPTGIVALAKPQGRAGRVTQQVIRSPLVGACLFNLLVSRPSIRFFLANQSYHDPAGATSQVLKQSYYSGHQPSARFAPAAFLSGALNSNVRQQFAELPQPVLIAWGQYAKPTPVAQAKTWIKLKPQAKLVIFEASGMLPHDEESEAFNRIANQFFDHI